MRARSLNQPGKFRRKTKPPSLSWGWVGRLNTSEVMDCFSECLQPRTGYLSGGRTEVPTFGRRGTMQILLAWLTELIKLEQPISAFKTGKKQKPKRNLTPTFLILWFKLLEGRVLQSIEVIFHSAEWAHRPKGLRNPSALCKNPVGFSLPRDQAGGVLTSQALFPVVGPSFHHCTTNVLNLGMWLNTAPWTWLPAFRLSKARSASEAIQWGKSLTNPGEFPFLQKQVWIVNLLLPE